MNKAIENLIVIAQNEVGVREGFINNTGTRVVEYQGATWLQPGAWPWCAAFTCWLMREWLEESDIREYLKQYFQRDEFTLTHAERVRCRDASAFGWESWAKQWKIPIYPETSLAKAGDFVVYDFSHIGLVIEDQHSISDAIKTIEGNTNGMGERDSDTGDGVWIKNRDPNLTKCYIRIFNE
ncbi:MAG: hypothetical protein N0E54_06350 [Candidatus Thiodiazotropha taylori]|nr:hypothetical protein [Candidatus Thiodiazotropha endolucinida]MCW4228341.1 hypothetical protein [Candidatus Thiodiazotropha taylori]